MICTGWTVNFLRELNAVVHVLRAEPSGARATLASGPGGASSKPHLHHPGRGVRIKGLHVRTIRQLCCVMYALKRPYGVATAVRPDWLRSRVLQIGLKGPQLVPIASHLYHRPGRRRWRTSADARLYDAPWRLSCSAADSRT